jgi:hypothetical protein
MRFKRCLPNLRLASAICGVEANTFELSGDLYFCKKMKLLDLP